MVRGVDPRADDVQRPDARLTLSRTDSSSSLPDALAKWVTGVHAANARFRRQVGRLRYGMLALAVCFLAAPRLLRRALRTRNAPTADRALQLPWLPRWPGLQARPLHDRHDHPWTERLLEARDDIRRELAAVQESFLLARYASDLNPKPWTTFYFYLEGRPVLQNLAACPRTAELLSRIPHNGFHVCFSAIEPGGSLHPHTGPTNASLTAHLGLLNCAGARLWVGSTFADYRDGDVLVFDDSFVHWVEHGGSQTRYTLMITFWHPELSRVERAFLSRIVRLAPR